MPCFLAATQGVRDLTTVAAPTAVYDTHMIMKRLSPDEYIMGAISLYLDFVNLFLYILRVVRARNVDGGPAQADEGVVGDSSTTRRTAECPFSRASASSAKRSTHERRGERERERGQESPVPVPASCVVESILGLSKIVRSPPCRPRAEVTLTPFNPRCTNQRVPRAAAR